MNAYYVYVYQETRWFKYLVLAECQRNAVYEIATRFNIDYKQIEAFPVDNDNVYFITGGEYQN